VSRVLTPFAATGIVTFIVTHDPLTQGRFREQLLQRLLQRLERRISHGRQASARFTRWRLFVFASGLIGCVVLYRLGWYQTGNSALLFFLTLFTTVAWYHNRLEDRMHRLHRWQALKSAHLARLQLDWRNIPPRTWSDVEPHSYARDLDLLGPHSLLHLIDTTVSTQGSLAGGLALSGRLFGPHPIASYRNCPGRHDARTLDRRPHELVAVLLDAPFRPVCLYLSPRQGTDKGRVRPRRDAP
jgi:hypothetical protein